MTTFAVPPEAPPISEAYVPDGHLRWRNAYSGDVVLWNQQKGVYQRWDPRTAAWSWWGHTSRGTKAWHLYQVRQLLDFWVLTAVGIIALIVGCVSGFPAVGIGAMGFFMVCGIFWSWLHTVHPNAYSIITVIGGLWAIGSLMGHRRHHIPW